MTTPRVARRNAGVPLGGALVALRAHALAVWEVGSITRAMDAPLRPLHRVHHRGTTTTLAYTFHGVSIVS
ncbi:MAG: hypothetical protein IPG50_30905 [Myxococcales bacterium]|nr:hypothetical protein [Myxococcales bacterium]